MTTYFCTGEVFLDHAAPDTNGVPHPERPDRLRAIWAKMDALDLRARCVQVDPRPATMEELNRVHNAEYLFGLRGRTRSGWLDEDTYFDATYSWGVATHAAGSAIEVTQRVLRGGQPSNALALVRPPGHHAGVSKPGGFCLLNNVAAAAAAARYEGARVAIVDFDAHHGNGTQEIFYESPEVLLVSTHQSPFYPYSGRAFETGYGSGEGYSINVEMSRGWGIAEFALAWDVVVLPALRRFAPDLILLSAGFDAHELDPEANLMLHGRDFAWLAHQLMQVQPRTVAVLEGGYHLEATAESAAALLSMMLDPDTFSAPASVGKANVVAEYHMVDLARLHKLEGR